ncbi:MAG: hypothetical protein ACXVQ0_08540 [Actinomycetota bacterium]
MTTTGNVRRLIMVLALILLVLAGVACSSGGGSSSSAPPTGAPTSSGPRPSSPATITIVSPTNGQVVHGTTVELKVLLKNAKVVPATTTHIVPTQGHLHVILDDQLISMNFATSQLIANLTPGQHLLKVEFVASDHLPWNPRIIAAVAFQVKQ